MQRRPADSPSRTEPTMGERELQTQNLEGGMRAVGILALFLILSMGFAFMSRGNVPPGLASLGAGPELVAQAGWMAGIFFGLFLLALVAFLSRPIWGVIAPVFGWSARALFDGVEAIANGIRSLVPPKEEEEEEHTVALSIHSEAVRKLFEAQEALGALRTEHMATRNELRDLQRGLVNIVGTADLEAFRGSLETLIETKVEEEMAGALESAIDTEKARLAAQWQAALEGARLPLQTRIDTLEDEVQELAMLLPQTSEPEAAEPVDIEQLVRSLAISDEVATELIQDASPDGHARPFAAVRIRETLYKRLRARGVLMVRLSSPIAKGAGTPPPPPEREAGQGSPSTASTPSTPPSGTGLARPPARPRSDLGHII